MTKHLIVVIGTTAIGKTKLSIALAKLFNAPILSCDSRQFFKEMTIGTAVPTPDKLRQAKHHFIQNKSIFEPYNVGQFEREAIELLDAIYQKSDIAIMVGGSGLYVDAILKGLDYFPDVHPKIRKNLNRQLAENGLEYLQAQLKYLDLESYQSIEISNPHRVIRALEICLATGKPYSSYKAQTKTTRIFTPILIGLTASRETIYTRINQRVDEMMANGLLEEVRQLYPYKNLNALQTVGYKELFAYFNQQYSLETAIEEIKKNTRHYAKRQETWFRKNKAINWFDFTNTDAITDYVAQKIKENDL